MCGRALGGHMRAHGVGDEIENLEDGDDPSVDWCSSDEDDDGGYAPLGGGGSGWCKRKRSSRVCSSENEEDIALAKCLMALSNTRVDLMEMEPESQKRNPIFAPVFLSNFAKPPPSALDKAKGVVTSATTSKGMFECKACKKVFNSHQALGGHRASHKNVKGCFATRNDHFDENSTYDDVTMHGDFKHTSTSQSDNEPSTGPVPLSGRKSKVHKCTICSRVFASGQALGGHKRCHWLTSNYTSDNYIGKFNFHEHIEQLHQRALAIPKELDLNLNLPVSGNTATKTQVPMTAKEDHKLQPDKNNGDQDDHIATTTMEGVDGEDFRLQTRNQKHRGKENTMKQSKDPFEVPAEDSMPDSPVGHADTETQDPAVQPTVSSQGADVDNSNHPSNQQKTIIKSASTSAATKTGKNKDDEDEEEEENMDVELGKVPSSNDPSKLAKMQSILSQFTEDQMSRYESFRRSGFQKSVMKRLLGSITGSNKVSMPMTIVVSGIAKIFVGELVETAKVVMKERKESGPIRPCHIREAYRRLKLDGKIPKRSVQRLFR
ncbi:hypothetical protein SSX86_012361 [Deinandra increscens subsp. villosa]|uniref:C2H2-type domain-containing protein n=1 Tax=Deinandra increscens subsp. villosa TaxID=3103831 RepID=A0AAP0H383_9ASTR